jgi:peptidyl-prolyl cis-trans isomerase C
MLGFAKRGIKFWALVFLVWYGLGGLPAWSAQKDALVSATGIELTRDDYEAAVSIIPKAKREQMSVTTKQVMIFLENVLVYRRLAEEARVLGLDKDPVIQREAQQAADRALGLRRLEALEAGLKLPDFTEAARERYVTHKADFTIAEAVRASHILVSAKGRSDDEARKRAEEARRKAVAGSDFTALAKEYSDDPSKDTNAGDLGFFERKQMVKPFEDAAFALSKPGEISPLVKTPFGYHIIRFAEKRPERVKPFDEVKEGIVSELRDKFIADAKASHISAIKNDKSIVIHEDAIKAMYKE